MQEVAQKMLELDIVSYNEAMSAGKWDRAVSLLNQMLCGSLEPSLVIFTTLMRVCQEDQKWNKAFSLL